MNPHHTTQNICPPNQNLEILKKNFPHCFDKNGNFDFEKFKKELSSSEINFSKESYGMEFLGKSYARVLATNPATTILKEDKNWNEKPENKTSENLLIKGDNLEVLKHLSNAYHEQVKMIYIDPPYNTGSDGFVYADDRKFSVKEFAELAGESDERAEKILSFVSSNSNSHSAWLTFMYPRLYIAKQLLKDDGVIFVSIDDNEVAQLRILMDEIFGEENFVGQIVWQTATDNNPSQIGIEHEYIICYSKNNSQQNEWEIESEKGFLIQEKYDLLKNEYNDDFEKIQVDLRKWIRLQNGLLSGVAHYSYVDNKGVYYPGNSSNTKLGGYQFDIIHPTTNKKCKKPDNGWRWPEKTFLEAEERGDVWFGDDENSVPKIKKRLDTVFEKLKSYYYEDNRYSTAELKKMFDNRKIFENPKSIKLIKHLLKFITNSNDLILDFFAGSGTTADAVMQLNAEDKKNGKEGNRKFIVVQLPEKIDAKKNKTAFDFVKNELGIAEPTIFEITKERIIRAAKKSEDQSGFKIFETQEIWEDYDFDAKECDEEQVLFDETQLTEDDLQNLLITWKTFDGVPLTHDLEKIDLSGYTGFYAKEKLYLMHKNFSTQNLKTLIEKIDEDKEFNPKTIIVFGYHFASKDLREMADNIKNYANKKELEIEILVRF